MSKSAGESAGCRKRVLLGIEAGIFAGLLVDAFLEVERAALVRIACVPKCNNVVGEQVSENGREGIEPTTGTYTAH